MLSVGMLCSSLVLAQQEIGTDQSELLEEVPAAQVPQADLPLPDADNEAKEKDSAGELEDRLRRKTLEDQAETRAQKEGREDASLADVLAAEQAPETRVDVEQSDVDVMDMDVAGSIDDAVAEQGYFKYGGDLRVAYNWEDQKFRDGSSERDDNFTGRLRFESQFTLRDNFRITARLAGRCSTVTCDPQLDVQGDDEEGTIENGTVILDELYVHWFSTERFNVALGRLQTRFVARGGVFAKSLDRNNSNNTNITYTDGLHATFTPGYGRGWVINLISEYNDDDGATTTRLEPLDFSKSSSKVSHFVALENNRRWGYIVQRGIDITYLNNALQVDGTDDGEIDDYWGFVTRTAARFPLGDGLQRLQLAGEFGYAPNTPTERAVDIELGGDDDDTDTSGTAWNVSASIMDFYPNHSIGFLYGRTGAGWLLSPQYGNNETQMEVRYNWRPDPDVMIDARLRYRQDIDRISGSSRRGEDWQFYARATVRYSVDNIFGFLD